MIDLEKEQQMVYQAAIQLIEIKGLDNFIEYLQEAAETGQVPKSCSLNSNSYLAILRQAVGDYRKKMLQQ